MMPVKRGGGKKNSNLQYSLGISTPRNNLRGQKNIFKKKLRPVDLAFKREKLNIKQRNDTDKQFSCE